MTLAPYTIDSHAKYCTKIGFADQLKNSGKDYCGAVGGAQDDESDKHLIARYLNSAARTQVIACIEQQDCEDIKLEVLGLLTDGHIYIIDIAAGHGAGTMSLLNTICKMRENLTLPMDPLDVDIHAIDFSQNALNHYECLLDSLKSDYSKFGIHTTIKKHEVDITDDDKIRVKIEEIKSEVINSPILGIGIDPRYLLLCSAISGVKKSVFISQFSKSYQVIAESFKENNSAFLWVEPLTEKKWMPKYWVDFMKDKPDVADDERSTKRIVKQEYTWLDPHSEGAQKTAADYLLMDLAK
ncbi:hypothetical protein MRBLMS1_005013 [Massilia sp. LMS1-1-1.1]